MPRRGVDGVDYVVTWHADRIVDQWASERTNFARRVGTDGSVTADLQLLFSEILAGFCNATTSGPLAAATTDDGLLLFTIGAFGCVDVGPFAGPDVSILTRNSPPVRDLTIEDADGPAVAGSELVQLMLRSTASAAARGRDALVRWLGTIPEPREPSRNGLWVEGSTATPIALGGTIAIASDGLGYLVLSAEAPSGDDPRELRAVPFDPGGLRIDVSAGVGITSADFRRTALASFGTGAYVAAHEDVTSTPAPMVLTVIGVETTASRRETSSRCRAPS